MRKSDTIIGDTVIDWWCFFVFYACVCKVVEQPVNNKTVRDIVEDNLFMDIAMDAICRF